MENWKKLVVAKSASIKEVIETLNNSKGAQIALVADNLSRLKGTITDGDLRRFMLEHKGIEGHASDAMNTQFLSVLPGQNQQSNIDLMQQYSIKQLPIVDETGILKGLQLQSELSNTSKNKNLVLIMAGGMGKRLMPLTEECPKPMLPVGGKPILETILLNFIADGFDSFVISINYLGEQIKNYFSNGEKWGVNISYIIENEPLGTVGAASLLNLDKIDMPVLITNGDVLTRVQYSQLLDFHNQSKAEITICLRDYKYEVPFGVVNMDAENVTGIIEKPVLNHHVSAGIYAVNIETLKRLSPNEHKDMPDLINELLKEKLPVSGYPLHEYWMDVGHHDELKLADQQYGKVFNL